MSKKSLILILLILLFLFSGCSPTKKTSSKQNSNDLLVAVQPIMDELPDRAFINGSDLRVRQYPSLEAKVLGKVTRYDLVQMLGHSPEKSKINGQEYFWYKIKLADLEGWVSGKYVNYTDIIPGLPPAYTDMAITTTAPYLSYHYLTIFNELFMMPVGSITEYYRLNYPQAEQLPPELREYLKLITQAESKEPNGLSAKSLNTLQDFYKKNVLKPYGIVERNSYRYTLQGLPWLRDLNPIKTLEKTLGKPSSIKKKVTKNIHYPDQKDTILTYAYNGLTVYFWQDQQRKATFIHSVVLSDAKYPTLFDIKVGSSQEYINKVLGQPTSPDQSNSEYYQYLEGDEGTMLGIYFKDHKVSRIIWTPYLD